MNLNDDCGDKTSKVILLFYIFYFYLFMGALNSIYIATLFQK